MKYENVYCSLTWLDSVINMNKHLLIWTFCWHCFCLSMFIVLADVVMRNFLFLIGPFLPHFTAFYLFSETFLTGLLQSTYKGWCLKYTTLLLVNFSGVLWNYIFKIFNLRPWLVYFIEYLYYESVWIFVNEQKYTFTALTDKDLLRIVSRALGGTCCVQNRLWAGGSKGSSSSNKTFNGEYFSCLEICLSSKLFVFCY